jgi:hypothetical protein
MMRTQPPGFRWLVGGFALVAAVAFGFHYRSARDPVDLLFGALCLAAAGYWLIFDREPPSGHAAAGTPQVAHLADDDDLGGGLGRGEKAVPDPGWEESR